MILFNGFSVFFSIQLVTEAASHKRKAHCSCALESGDLCYTALKISLLILTSSLKCLPQISTNIPLCFVHI